MNTYLFGIGEGESKLTIFNFQKPQAFEFLIDNMLMERNRLIFNELEGNKTQVNWLIYSRRKSILFRVSYF